MRCSRPAAVLWLAMALAGCAHYPVNAPMGTSPPPHPYRFPEMSLERPDPADELFVCLSFSGGG
ncbi:MAG TPA: patatin-like phospholipase family protein, partial [Candidatus Methylomirabilis sp.]|nr:patatin-like phospholipase family protein [Candidatus Methylomirabilis sp.]